MANIVLAIVFQREENIEYLSVAIFLMALNGILVFKAIKVYKKMKGKNIQSIAINKYFYRARTVRLQ